MKKILFAALLLTSLTSCYNAQFTVGDGTGSKSNKTETYDKSKQMWLFWGLVNINEGQASTPTDGNYVIKTKTNFGDGLLTALTAGIFTMKTVKIEVKKEEKSK